MDWKQLLARLTAAGLTQIVIADRCGVAQSTISALVRGETKSPSYELGKALEKLVESLPPPESDSAQAESHESRAESATRVPPAAESAIATQTGV